MEGRTAVEPQPWWQVVLAILPGVMSFVGTNLDNFGWQVRLPWPIVLSVLVLLPVSSIVWAVARRPTAVGHPLREGLQPDRRLQTG